jgi:hypothetical protein
MGGNKPMHHHIARRFVCRYVCHDMPTNSSVFYEELHQLISNPPPQQLVMAFATQRRAFLQHYH